MEKQETRIIAVKYCDFCGKEKQHLSRCVVCKKEMCNENGGKAHAVYGIELYRYSDGQRLISSPICTTCGDMNIIITISQLLDGMMKETPVLL